MTTGDEASFIRSSEFKARLQHLRQTDDFTNFLYLGLVWLYLAVVIGGAVALHRLGMAAGVSPWWSVAGAVVAIVLVGAGQHNLTALAHEAAHYILCSNRFLNDLVSDWACMFPMFSTTHHYRLQHMAHHQFVNDPGRDPDVSQLQTSGHWLRFPLAKGQFLRMLVRQLWLPNLAKYIRVRARYNSMGTDKNPYLKKDYKPSKIPVRVGLVYLVTLVGTLATLVWTADSTLLAVAPPILWGSVMLFYALIPARWYHQSRIHPVISSRAMTLMRMTFMSGLFWSLAWIEHRTEYRASLYFLVLWVVPLFTSFSFLMVLRQIVQHGNGDRGWLTNTRTFLVAPLIRFSVFPMGQDYHLPHHMFATVPHYRLRQLHELLLGDPEYRDRAVVVEGYFLPRERPPKRPTVIEVLGPAFHRGRIEEVYIDDSVLDAMEVEDRDAILREGREEARRLGAVHRAAVR